MARKQITEILHVVHPICCGLDVHKSNISACLVIEDEAGRIHEEIKEFGTFTRDLEELKSWLLTMNCPIAAIESTGVYWRPVFNVLEDAVEVVLVNARHVKNVPGRKTDVSDAKWLAGLLRNGLLRGSFIPPKEVRNWRHLFMLRKSFMETLGDFKRRTHKHLQACNIKIDSVASDLFSVTGRNLMALILSDPSEVTVDQVKGLARRGLKNKAEELYLSIQGFVGQDERYVLAALLETIKNLEDKIQEITDRMRFKMSDHQEALDRLDQAPGINDVGAMCILAIVGPDLSAFPTSRHFCSWAGLCPGNNQSAGKRKSGRSPVKKHPLRTLLVELAWAATKKKGSYFRDKFFRLRSRIGAKPAIFAIAHRLGKAVYHILKRQQDFLELGDDFLDQRNQQAKLQRLKRQAESLGFKLVQTAEA